LTINRRFSIKLAECTELPFDGCNRLTAIVVWLGGRKKSGEKE
jgi:hypothetical protein